MQGDLLSRFDSIRLFTKGGVQAPHKPLLLLYALAQLKNAKIERIAFTDAEDTVGPLVQTYGPFNADPRVNYPYARLANDKSGIWWIEEHEKNPSGDLRLTEARNRNIKAGFSDDVLRAFREDPKLIDLVAINLLERNFPPSLHPDVLEAVGLYLGQDEFEAFIRKKRDPRFRNIVLTAYYEQCAICKCDIKMNGAPIALEAAHIQMHAAGGPDEVNNGLALCVIHHKLFDLGALTVDRNMNVRVSERVVGEWGRKLNDEFHGRPIALPRSETMAPSPQYIHWHNKQIFKGTVG
ncbi:HNH endonuclease [Seohaeicola sp. SP36]|uniref:phosphorothioated DNA-binding restriction endonuclease n=1 Tax=unclassified Seohaeicola TaxID=2641111 RepID=UPI00237B6EAD|nr:MULTISPECIES: HNH endonuclease [unclassified Seohaeicola]MDD9709820.1 HNH endonuclease [Seohaeicola sp. 4SK31]MDD9738067.1 HNH endonuclease [Seohaeicola sp. SP36]